MGAGDPLGFTPNKAIEGWSKFKEDYHIRFRFTPRRLRDIALWGFAVPTIFYYIIKNNQEEVDRQNKRKPRDYFG